MEHKDHKKMDKDEKHGEGDRMMKEISHEEMSRKCNNKENSH